MESGCDCQTTFKIFLLFNKQQANFNFLSKETHKHPLRCHHTGLTYRGAGLPFSLPH